MRELRPFFSYFGSKWRLAPTYPAPEHETLIEPFAGGAGYACRHYRRRVILIERDPRIAALWRWLIRVSPEEVMRIPLFGGEIRTTDDMRGIAEEARDLVGFWLFKGDAKPRRVPSPIARRKENEASFWSLAIKLRIARQVQRIRHWTVIDGGYEDAPDAEATWFCDPPYVAQALDGIYRHGSSAIDFGRLAGWCRSRRGLTIVCEARPADWLPFEPHALAAGATTRPNNAGFLSEELVYVQRR